MDYSRLFQTSRTRWTSMEEYCDYSKAALVQVATSVASNDETPVDERVKKLKRLKKCGDRLAKLSVKSKCRGAISKELFDASRDEALEPEKIRGIYQSGLNTTKRQTTKATCSKDFELKNIDKIMKKITGTTDNDIEEDMTTQQAQSLCPILKCALDNPMKNMVCGHVYSLKGAIHLLMQANASSSRTVPSTLAEVPDHYSARCPQYGCNKLLKPSTLKRDFATELTQRQQQASTQEPETMEIEDV
ncbi:E3 SUMO-protein ligase Nse2 (Mms21) [Gracilaria domingensis]|nr:E3 SUMO-protein ligase Nse2 (Mms21) [Gracilaria domingensis]